jgi:hypothetical protein
LLDERVQLGQHVLEEEEAVRLVNHCPCQLSDIPSLGWDLRCFQRMSNACHWMQREKLADTPTVRDHDFLQQRFTSFWSFSPQFAKIKNVFLAPGILCQMLYKPPTFPVLNFINSAVSKSPRQSHRLLKIHHPPSTSSR